MNENINLVELLKDCPKGTKLYTPIAGEVFLEKVHSNRSDCPYPIDVRCNTTELSFCKNGMYFGEFENEECLLFPSKDQRDWSKWEYPKPKFDPKTLQLFDRVLVRNHHLDNWCCTFFSHHSKAETDFKFITIDETAIKYCIPYNEETKHLVGTKDEVPEFYRYWED